MPLCKEILPSFQDQALLQKNMNCSFGINHSAANKLPCFLFDPHYMFFELVSDFFMSIPNMTKFMGSSKNLLFLLTITTLCGSIITRQKDDGRRYMNPLSIWLQKDAIEDNFGEFYISFEWHKGVTEVRISADSDYTLYIK